MGTTEHEEPRFFFILNKGADKVGSAIQWIDNPLNILIGTFKFTAFFGDDGVLWVRFTNRVDNHRFGSFIYVGHEIVTAFLARFYSVRGFIVFGN